MKTLYSCEVALQLKTGSIANLWPVYLDPPSYPPHYRQLLLYSVRYSSSFPREKRQEELKKVEPLLNGFHGSITKFLIDHFSQTSVRPSTGSSGLISSQAISSFRLGGGGEPKIKATLD